MVAGLLPGRAACAGGQAAGVVRSRANAHDCQRARAGAVAPPVPGREAAAGDAGSERVLGWFLSSGQKRDERALSQAPLAGRSLECFADEESQAAGVGISNVF